MAGTGIFGTGTGRKNVLTELADTGYCGYGSSVYSTKQGRNMLILKSDNTTWQAGIGRYWKVPVLQ
jgi:hypothetical protein